MVNLVFGCSVILVVLVGAWITGGWITGDGDIRHWHPGYFLPTASYAGNTPPPLDLKRLRFALLLV